MQVYSTEDMVSFKSQAMSKGLQDSTL
jgi:hypothetical protein